MALKCVMENFNPYVTDMILSKCSYEIVQTIVDEEKFWKRYYSKNVINIKYKWWEYKWWSTIPNLNYPEHIQHLVLTDIGFRDFPFLPKRIRSVNLGRNELKCISNLDRYIEMTVLILNFNKISQIDTFPPKLEYLNMSANCLQHSTQINWQYSMHLKTIDLSFNKFMVLPANIPANVQVLNFSKNNFFSLTDNVYKFKHLHTLILGYTSIQFIPRLQENIQFLELGNCPVVDFSSIASYSKLRGLSINDTWSILNLNSFSVNLIKLQLNRINLGLYYDDFTHFKQLKILHIQDNLYNVPPKLPANLEELDLNYNRIRNCSGKVLQNVQLKILSMVGNKLKRMPKKLPYSLHTLLLGNNLIKTGIGNLLHLENLHRLCLSNNNMKQVPKKWPINIKNLDISKNPFVAGFESLSDLQHIEILNLK